MDQDNKTSHSAGSVEPTIEKNESSAEPEITVPAEVTESPIISDGSLVDQSGTVVPPEPSQDDSNPQGQSNTESKNKPEAAEPATASDTAATLANEAEIPGAINAPAVESQTDQPSSETPGVAAVSVTNETATSGSVAEMKTEVFRLPNAMVGRAYSENIPRKDLGLHDSGIDTGVSNDFEALGLKFILGDEVVHLEGEPLADASGEKTISVECYREGKKDKIVQLQLFINPDPRSLWKEIEPDPSLPFPKSHTDEFQETTEDFFIVAASRRGRSHANEGTFREDHCAVNKAVNGWALLVVSDGAGSASLSRLGSELACTDALNFLNNKKEELAELGNLVEMGGAVEGSENEGQLRTLLYELLAGAAFSAAKRLETEAETQGIPLKDLSCTFLLAIVKKIKNSTFIASFGIGDGAVGVFRARDCWSRLMIKPDGGEFSGQTRFLTMPEIFINNEEVMKRIDFDLLEDFTSLFVMSDGVSDPKFGTDSNLQKSHKWFELATEIGTEVDLSRSNESASKQLLEWLNFWVQGEHDDRAIVILSK